MTTLEKRLRDRAKAKSDRLVSVAIQRDGKVHSGLRSHYELRRSMNDINPASSNPYDIEGFMTAKGSFVTREQAVPIGVAAGQLHPSWAGSHRRLLSSNIDW